MILLPFLEDPPCCLRSYAFPGPSGRRRVFCRRHHGGGPERLYSSCFRSELRPFLWDECVCNARDLSLQVCRRVVDFCRGVWVVDVDFLGRVGYAFPVGFLPAISFFGSCRGYVREVDNLGPVVASFEVRLSLVDSGPCCSLCQVYCRVPVAVKCPCRSAEWGN